MHLTIVDNSEEVFEWCIGQTDVDQFLQVSPNEYIELPEVLTHQLIQTSYNVPILEATFCNIRLNS
jgi:hypothetical protein